MPEQWTADLVGRMHLHSISRKQLAAQLGLNDKYVLMVLNGKRHPPNAEERFVKALDALIAQKVEE